MQFFENYYKYEEEAPEEGSEEYAQICKEAYEKGQKYNEYLQKIKSCFQDDFLDIYDHYTHFQGWDLTRLEFDHSTYNHPNIIAALTQANSKEAIIIKYFDVVSFNTNLTNHYFESYRYGTPGLIGVNEFELIDGNLCHEIYFNTPERVKICCKKIEVEIKR